MDAWRAARFYFLPVNAFGGKVSGRSWSTAATTPPGLNLLRLEEQLSAAHPRLAHAYVENLDWRACVERYDREHTLFYLNPPSWDTESYNAPFLRERYAEIANVLRRIRGRAVLSVYDHPETRRVYAGFP